MEPSLKEKLEGKAAEVVLGEFSKEHAYGTSVNVGGIGASFKVGEAVALKGTKAFENLVAPDSRRAAFAEANPGQAWVKTSAQVGVSASLPLGVGAHLGFSGNIEVTTIAPHTLAGVKAESNALWTQARLMVPLDAAALLATKSPPGTELMFRGTVSQSASIGVGSQAQLNGGPVSVNAQLGASVSTSAQAQYTKNVKLLEGGRVLIQISEIESATLASRVGAQARVDFGGLNAQARAEVMLAPQKDGQSALVGKGLDQAAAQAPKLLDKVADQAQLDVSCQVSAVASQKVMGAVVLDLNTQAGKDAYNQILWSLPRAAAEIMRTTPTGVRYTGSVASTHSSLNVQVGSANLLSASTFETVERGQLESASGKTQLAEGQYKRDVNGFFPRLFLGEERSVQVRAGELTDPNGVRHQAMAVSLSLKDTNLTATETAELQRFARHMGLRLEVPEPAQSAGKATVELGVAMSEVQLSKLSQWDESSLMLAFACAGRDIEGKGQLPVWQTNPQEFAAYRSRLRMATDKGGEKMRVAADFNRAFGSSLSDEVSSFSAASEMSKEIVAQRGKPAGEWGPMLSAIGSQSSSEVRVAILGLRRLAGAEVLALDVKADGVAIHATPEAPAPATLTEYVGRVMTPE